MKILNGQRAAEYENLYSEMTLQWNSTNSISFYIRSLIGNTIQIVWDDDSVENTVIETTGIRQSISMNFSNSKQRSITLKGSGVYTLTQIQIAHDSFKCMPIIDEKCMQLPNLTTLNFSQSRYFEWSTIPKWSLVPKLKTLNLYQCRYKMNYLPLEDKNNRPERLQSLNLYYSQSLSGINLADFTSLKNIHITQLGNNYSNFRGDIILSGCTNLVSAYIYECDYVSGFYFNDCQNLKIINFNNQSDSYCKYGQILDITNDSALTGLSLYGFGRSIPASANVELKRGNNLNYVHQWMRYNSFNVGIIPDYNTTPNLSSLTWNQMYRAAGQLDFSNFTNLKRVSFENCYDYYGNQNLLSSITCNNNRSLSSVYMRYCYNITEAEFQNCTQLYNLEINGNDWDDNGGLPSGNLQEAIIKNNPKLYDLVLNYNTLTYGLTLEGCPNLYEIQLNYTQLRKLTLQDIPNLYTIDIVSDTNFQSKLTQVNITNCGQNRTMDIYIQQINSIKTINIDNYYNLDDVYFTDNESLTRVIMRNGTDTSFDFSIDGSNINYFDFTNNYFSTSHMNNILNSINNSNVENGKIIFTGNQYGYRPDTSYISPLLSKGWEIIYN